MNEDMTRRCNRGTVLRVCCTIFAIAGLWLVYGSSEWIPWRLAIIKALAAIETLAGTPLGVAGFDVALGGVTTYIGHDCTYAQWIATAVPLLWVATARPYRVLATLGGVAVCQVVNVGRIYMALLAAANGIPWLWAHDIPDYVLWYGSIAVLVWWALRTVLNGEKTCHRPT